jgi:RNA polymerase sigma factor (sigma-70 family)
MLQLRASERSELLRAVEIEPSYPQSSGVGPVESVDIADDRHVEEILGVDEALQRLEAQDIRAADVVRLRHFVGLSVQETAEALRVSERTVKREWAFARAWLYNELRSSTF